MQQTTVQPCPEAVPPEGARERILLMTLRQCLIMALGALEDYLGIKRSIQPRNKLRG